MLKNGTRFKILWIEKFHTFFNIISGHLLLAILSRFLLINETVFYNTYSGQLTYERTLFLFENSKKLAWVGYVVLPVFMLIKFTLVSAVIYAGVFFLENSDRITFGKIFGVVIGSELIFILAGFTKLLWFYFFAGNYSLNELSYFFPLSLSNFFDINEIDKIWIFPLQTLNLFQIAYVLLLAFGLQSRSGISRSVAEKSVLVSYLPGLILIISLVMFLSIGKTI